MNVLDLDLDFFQNGRITGGDPTCRSLTTAWSARRVRDYLENNLHLSKMNKIPGRVFIHHDQAFEFWDKLIKVGWLTKPFCVYHVDAHSDFGYMGTWCYDFFNKYVGDYYFSYKEGFPTYDMHEGNFMCYALAKRWFSEVNYIYNDTDSCFQGDDISPLILKDMDIDSNALQICQFRTKLDPQYYKYDLLKKRFAFSLPVQLNRYKGASFSKPVNYDFISLSISPHYIVDESWGNVSVIKEYIKEI